MNKILYLAIILSLVTISASAQRQNGRNNATHFSEELTAVITGSGSPQYNSERAGPSVLIRYKDQNILVDMGNGSRANLEKINFNYRQLNGIFITHHHLDHNEEFIPVFVQTLLGGNKFEIVGPTPTKEYVSSVSSIYKKDIEYRLGRRGGRGYSASIANFTTREIGGGENFNIKDIKISTVRVNHTIETIAYRFEAGGKSIVVSGDLTYSESLSALAQYADVLIIDSGAVRSAGNTNFGRGGRRNSNRRNRNRGQQQNRGGQTGRRQRRGGGERAHSTLDEVGKMANDARVKTLIMNHLPNVEIDEEAVKTEVAKRFKGKVIFAKDLLEIK